MKLQRLIVKNFAAIRDVDIPFGPGLNVLYGPNDLGKSTLVEAIRLALLLPHGSGFCEPYVSWTGNGNPTVELTFETEPQRIWRVRKEFGKSGSSLLQASKDGQDFDDVERARKVDGRLREILRWGIPEPGGSGAGKGLPESFLASTLLSTQADVTDMLRATLDRDPATSGKEWIAAALQAVAQDPLFVALLRNVQARRDEAYTDKGAKKQARGAIFKLAADRVNSTREEKEKLQKIVSDSEGTEKQLQDLNERRALKHETLAKATENATDLGRLAALSAARAVAAEQVRLAEAEVQRISQLGSDVEQVERHCKELLDLEGTARQGQAAALQQKTEADKALKIAEDLARVEGTNSSDGDTVLRQKLELRIVAADQNARSTQQQIDAAATAQQLIDAAATTEKQYLEQQVKARGAKDLHIQAKDSEQGASQSLVRCELLEKALDTRSAQKAVDQAQAAVVEQRTFQADLDEALVRQAAMVGRKTQIVVPRSSAVAAMHSLSAELAAAKGSLDVGFTVTVAPKRSVGIEVRKDGEAPATLSTTKELVIEASAQVELDIADLVSVEIRGGRREAQEKVRTLERRWNLDVAPHLTAANVTDLAGLDAKIVESRELEASIKANEVSIRSLRLQITRLAGAAEAHQQASDRLENCRSALGEEPIETFSADLNALGVDPVSALRKKRQQFAKAVEAARTTSSEAATASTIAEERANALQSALDAAIAKRDVALTAFPEGVAAALTRGQADLKSSAAEAGAAKAELASLDATVAQRKARIEATLTGARDNCTKTSAALDAAQRQLEDAIGNHAALAGQLTQLKKLRDAQDLAGAESKLREMAERHAALPAPERIVTEADVNAARNVETNLSSDLKIMDQEIQRAHGALAQVGGSVARERLRDATEAFELAQQQDREIEADCEAWKLLLDQMKEADAAQASNLGHALAPAIASRFQTLTDQRYETVRLSASLGTDGVIVDGNLRSSGRMSVGTREQLSTLYRLSLAEYLGTVVVLDDQLVQSDESRMDWFRDLLKEKSQAFQIVVFTCRPRDYLEKGSMVAKGKPFYSDTNEGYIRAIDLGRVLSRVKAKAL